MKWIVDCATKQWTGEGVKRVAVYCGSAQGTDPAFLAEAVALGEAIARAGSVEAAGRAL